MYTCGFRINANLVKEGSFLKNAQLVKEELNEYLNRANHDYSRFNPFYQPFEKMSNFYPLKVVDRGSEILLQVGENLKYLI